MDLTNLENRNAPTLRIDTTVGDLIHAIAEAAQEATISAEECAELTQAVFVNLIMRRQAALTE